MKGLVTIGLLAISSNVNQSPPNIILYSDSVILSKRLKNATGGVKDKSSNSTPRVYCKNKLCQHY